MKTNPDNAGKSKNKMISRKKAINKMGVTALTMTTFYFLETKAAAAESNVKTPIDSVENAQRLGGRRDGGSRTSR